MLCPLCQYSISWVIIDIHDGMLHSKAHFAPLMRFMHAKHVDIKAQNGSQWYSRHDSPFHQQAPETSAALHFAKLAAFYVQLACATLALCAGVCLGTTASVCQPELPWHFHFHSTVLALGVAGVQCGFAKLSCG